MEELLSIIVPVYNVEKYIESAIKSLLNQDKFNFEIILVDDGSTDNAGIICDNFRNLFPDKIQVLHKVNGGLPSARKAGVDIAKGTYISFLDGDDWCKKDYYYNMFDAVVKTKSDIACSGFTYAYDKCMAEYRNTVPGGVYEGEKLEELKKQLLYTLPYYTYGICPSLCMKVVKAELIKKHIYNVPNGVTLAEDASCTYPMLFSSNKIVVLSENNGYFYRQIESSMTHAYNPNKIEQICLVMDFLNSVFEPFYAQYGRQIDAYFSQLIKDGIRNEMDSKQSIQEKKNKLMLLRNKAYTQRTLRNIQGIPWIYKIYFGLFERNQYTLLTFLLFLLEKIKRS